MEVILEDSPAVFGPEHDTVPVCLECLKRCCLCLSRILDDVVDRQFPFVLGWTDLISAASAACPCAAHSARLKEDFTPLSVRSLLTLPQGISLKSSLAEKGTCVRFS